MNFASFQTPAIRKDHKLEKLENLMPFLFDNHANKKTCNFNFLNQQQQNYIKILINSFNYFHMWSTGHLVYQTIHLIVFQSH